MDRREFLLRTSRAGLALAGACLLPTGCTARAASSPAVASGPRETRVLRKPLSLTAGETLENLRLVLAPDFRFESTMAALWIANPNITLRNVELVGASRWQRRWNLGSERLGAPPGVCASLAAIKIQKAPRLRIENALIHGFPREGIVGHGLDDGVIRDVEIHSCMMGVRTEQYAPSRRLRIERVRVHDTWGLDPAPSPSRPGVKIGGPGFALTELRDAKVLDCRATGELSGSCKLVHPKRVEVARLTGMNFSIQGTNQVAFDAVHPDPAEDVWIHDSTIDKSLGFGRATQGGHGISLYYNVKGVRVVNCILRAAGRHGNAIQLNENAHATVRGCTIEGFNGLRAAPNHPAYALQLYEGCTINDDFLTANRFQNQQRKVLRKKRG